MNKYECILRDKDGYRWSLMFEADDFAHAEEQCKDVVKSNENELIKIVKDYKTGTV